MRLIDADKLKPDFIHGRWESRYVSEQDIIDAPTVDAVPVAHGHWIDCKGSNGKDYRKCSVCLHTQEITGVLNYCSICGARMDEVTE